MKKLIFQGINYQSLRLPAYKEDNGLNQVINIKIYQNNCWIISFYLKGEIQFKNVFMKYKKELDFSLKGINFTIKPKEKVGCIGRTGAGKSSIIEALFRMRD